MITNGMKITDHMEQNLIA